ncbi:neuronal acetylcholine receptor subunit alpha-10-like isoform X2 [Mizuhopecten yessoensis]|uniref:Neuronal acetylcholine receptor subunit alpha-10 n=1 Tax=Mizuhopecten yessoensis TaxID=6573 RepID=A0A210QZI2_MIZYE|nr:neuronal acetylcholine receptor subunit alpha-10-like isoform X2 [Mizuhopecten yessoensis]OWF54137.1 Neuronal acetylcholine receptor subunit alpha-10 [Mizuhopecten yessoensis]
MALFGMILTVSAIRGVNTNLQDQLVRDLFASYDRDVRPQCEHNDKVNATADMSLRQIIDLDEPKQILKLNVWIRTRWTDCRLTWDPANYSNIDHIVLPYARLWVPDLVLYDNAESTLSGIKDFRAGLTYTGHISYNFPSILNSLCAINVRYFPFDTQTCPLIFGSWAYNGLELDISNASSHTGLASFVRSIEWEVIDAPIKYSQDWYGDTYWSTVTFTFNLERKPLFYIMNILCPCLLITCVAVFGFMLPPDSGEKVNLEITVLLSLAVFQLIVLETIPPSGDSTPFLGLYFMVSMALVGTSCLLTVFVLQVHYKGNNGTRMPGWVKRCIMGPLSRITCVKITDDDSKSYTVSEGNNTGLIIPNGSLQCEQFEKVNYSKTQDNAKTQPTAPATDGKQLIYPLHSVLKGISDRLEYFRRHIESQQNEATVDKDWSLLAVMMDRVFMVVYIVIVVTVALSMILPVVLRNRSFHTE